MIRPGFLLASAFALAIGSPGIAGGFGAAQVNAPVAASGSDTAVLEQGLHAVMNSAAAVSGATESSDWQGHASDNSEGADNASAIAIARVCGSDTPAATHAAICRPISPE